jgi:hypothetical protein
MILAIVNLTCILFNVIMDNWGLVAFHSALLYLSIVLIDGGDEQ